MPKKQRKWTETKHRLADVHNWRAAPGYSIFVADGGAVRFDIPSHWIVVPSTTSFKFHDRKPPDDECTIELSVNHLPPADFRDFPLEAALGQVLADGYERAIERGPVVPVRRDDQRLAWSRIRYLDDAMGYDREAIAYTLLGLRRQVQILITMAFWADDAAEFEPVWDVLLGSVRLAEPVDMLGNPVRRNVH
jgi:hypothetical protein